ncbi:MAG TPA: hypothetical protein DDY31_07175, partial [Lachnospiraceae bacterium]|nr:hypothetical protein [Lachnospiraceae bacterium]
LEYEAREKAIRDHNQFLLEARQKGRKEGIEKGRKEEKLEIAKNLIILGYPTKEITRITALPANQIDKLR